jgi:HEAT repeat protein
MDFHGQRKREIEQQIKENYSLLKEYEDKLRLSDSPKERALCRVEISQLKASLAEKEIELKKNLDSSYSFSATVNLSPNNLVQEHFKKIVSDTRFCRWDSNAIANHYVSLQITDLKSSFPLLVLDYDFQGNLGSQPRDAVEVVSNANQIAILGEPGAGKTTVFEKVMYETAKHGVESSNVFLTLPVIVKLNQYNNEESLIPLITLGLRRHGVLNWQDTQTQKILEDKSIKLLLLLDGLNEVSLNSRRKIVRIILKLFDAFPLNCYAVNCRIQDYNFDFGEIPTVVIQSLCFEQINNYIAHHLGVIQGRLFYANLSEQLKEICKTPIGLSMLTAAAQQGFIPQNKGQLYAEFTRSILWREGSKGEKANETPSQLKRIALINIAFNMQQAGVLDFSEKQIRDTLNPVFQEMGYSVDLYKLLEEIKLNGLLIDEKDSIRFSHQSFQEYFAAESLERDFNPRQSNLSKYIKEPWWREVILMMAGITSHPSQFIHTLLLEDPFLAAKCLVQGCSPDFSIRIQVIDAIGKVSQSPIWTEAYHAAEAMGELRDKLAIPYLVALLSHYERGVRLAALYSLRQISAPESTSAILPSLSDTDWAVRGEAARILGDLLAENFIADLVQMLNDEHPYPRGRAAYGIYLLIKNNQSLNLIKHLKCQTQNVVDVGNWIVRIANSEELSEQLIGSLQTSNLQILEAALHILVEEHKRIDFEQSSSSVSQLLSHKNFIIRASAIQALGRLQVFEQVAKIKQIMCADPIGIVREIAAYTLYLLNAKETIKDMIERLHIEQDSGVKRRILVNIRAMQAVQAVPDIEAVLSDSSIEVRSVACQCLGALADYQSVERHLP